jgi:hypothetical protein
MKFVLEPVRLSIEHVREHLLRKGHSLEEAEPLAIRYAREARAGMTIGSAFDADISLSGVTVMGALHFHFRVGRDFNSKGFGEETALIIDRAAMFRNIGNRPLNEVLDLIKRASFRRIIAPDGQVWGDEG